MPATSSRLMRTSPNGRTGPSFIPRQSNPASSTRDRPGASYGLDTRFLYYRKDIFTKAGLPSDWQAANVADILTSAVQIKQNVPDVLPYALYGGQAGSSGTADHAFVPLVWAYGGEMINADGKWFGDSAAIRKALDYYVQAFQTTRSSIRRF